MLTFETYGTQSDVEKQIDASLNTYVWSVPLQRNLQQFVAPGELTYYQRLLVVRYLEQSSVLKLSDTSQCAREKRSWNKSCYVGTSQQNQEFLNLLQRPEISCYLQEQDALVLLQGRSRNEPISLQMKECGLLKFFSK